MSKAAIAFLCFLLVGCSKDKAAPFVQVGVPGAGSTTLTGVYAGGGDGGLAQVTVSSATLAAPIRMASRSERAASALMTLSPDNGGGAVNLAGSYDDETDSIRAGGSGYDVSGQWTVSSNPDAIVGDYAGPNGPGAWIAAVGSTSAISSYCGTFENASASLSGRSHLMVKGGSILGIASYSGGSTAMRLTGSAGDSTLSGSGGLNSVTREAAGTWVLYVMGAVADHGTWSATLCRTAGTGPD